MDTLESLKLDVERACNSPEALSRLVQALLEYRPTSELAKTYAAQLIWYVFYKRRRAIAFRSGKILSLPDGRGSTGCGPRSDMEVARDAVREIERRLVEELGLEEVQAIKQRVGKLLSLRECISRIAEGRFNV